MTLTQQPPSESGASVSDARHYPTVYHHHHPSPMMLQGAPPQQVASYVVAGPSGGHPGVLQGQPVPLTGPNSAYPSSTPGPAAFPGSTLNQPLLQQHTYIQQPVQQVRTSNIVSAVNIIISICHHELLTQLFHRSWICAAFLLQMSTCYCSSAHHSHCSSQQQQHYRAPVNALPYNCPQNQNLPHQQGTTSLFMKVSWWLGFTPDCFHFSHK